MSVQDLVDRNLVEWETRYQAAVTRAQRDLIAKHGQKGYEEILAIAQRKDEIASQAYRAWAALAEQTPSDNPTDQTAYVRGLNAAKERALADVPDAKVRAAVQKRIEGEMDDVLSAAVAFKALKDQFGMTYGSPEDAMQEFLHRPEAMQGALGHVMGGFSDFRRFWDEIRPDVERLRQMNPDDEGAVQQAVAGSTLSKAMGMLLSDSTSRMTVRAATGGDSREYVQKRFLKGLDDKDKAAVEANPEPFVDFAQARALYIQGAASAEQIAAQNAKEKGTTYREELSKQGAVLNALHEKLVEMKAGLPEINRQAALWIPPDAKGFQENPGPVSTFFRGMARGALSAINPFANQGQLALVAPRTQNPEHKAGFIPWNAQAWGEAVAELGVSTPGFMAGGEVAGGVKLAKPLLQRAAQGAVAGGVGMLAQPAAVKEAATGDVPGLARRGLGGAVAGAGLGAAGGAVERAAFNWRAGKALGDAIRKAPEPDASGQAISSLRPTRPTASLGESATRAGLTEAAESSAPIPMRVRPARPAPTPKVRFERKSQGVFRSEDGRFTVRRLGKKEWVVEDRGLYEVGGKRHTVVSNPVSSSLEAMKIARNRVAGHPVGTGTKGGGPDAPMVPGKKPTKAPRPKKPAPYEQPDAELPEFGTVPFARGPRAEPPWSGLSLAARSREAAKAATPTVVTGQVAEATAAPEVQAPVQTVQEKILQALKEAKPVRGEQAKAYSAERSRRLREALIKGQEAPGEAGFRGQLSALKGELPKVQYESVRGKVTQTDIDELFNQIEGSRLLAGFEKIGAKNGLAKLVGRPGVQVPTDSEMELLGRVFGQDFVDTVVAKRGTLHNALGLVSQIVGTPRTLMASTDFSAPLRQGVVAAAGYPKQWASAFGEMFRLAKSDAAFEALGEDIVNRPSYEAMRKGGLALSSIRGSAKATAREEQFMSTLAEKIPVFGRVVRASERAHVGFLTKLRADIFDELVKRAEKAGATIDDKFYKDASNFINAATGRGQLPGALHNAGGALSTAFFSPRLVASRLEILSSPVTYMNASPVVRQEALRTLFNFTAAGTTILGLAAAAGVDVGTDPRSAEFGKMKLGKTRVDIWGGFQQYPRLAAQLMTGELKSSVTGKVTKLGGHYGAPTRKDLLARFAESKANPAVGFALRLAEGKDIEGKPIKMTKEVRDLFIPLVFQDIEDIAKTDPNLLPLLIPATFGVGVQTYPVPEKK